MGRRVTMSNKDPCVQAMEARTGAVAGGLW